MKSCIIFRTLALAGVLFWGGRLTARPVEKPEPADLIIYNAKVLTVDSNFTVAQAIAVRGEQIVAVGKNKQVQLYKDPHTREIDAKGWTIMPGLCDGHVYSYEASVSESNAASTGFKSIADALAYIRKRAAQTSTNGWIIVERTYPTRVKENRLPTKAELDAASPSIPVYWDCGDLAMVNAKALDLCKINRKTVVPPGCEVVMDPETRQPNGLLYHPEKLLKLPDIKPPTTAVRREALKKLYGLYNQQGITSIGERRADTAAIDLFRELSRSNELTVRIVCTRFLDTGASVDDALAHLDAVTNAPAGKLPYGPTGVGDDWVRIGALNIQMDGGLRTGTAYLRTPWGMGPTYQVTHPSYRGHLEQDPEVLPAVFIKAAQSGWQVAADCTGDAAMDQLVNCYQKAKFKTDIREHRFLISHATFQTEENWELCKKLGLAADMQPAQLYRDGASLLKTLGYQRLTDFLALKSSFDHGITIGGGSGHVFGLDPADSINPWNPWLGMWVTLTRQTDGGEQITPEEALSREQAIRFYTINNAWLNFAEAKQGSLEIGKFADLIMVDKDLLKCPVDDIRNVHVQLTMVGGKIVWEAK